jgi:hypothetical protein
MPIKPTRTDTGLSTYYGAFYYIFSDLLYTMPTSETAHALGAIHRK